MSTSNAREASRTRAQSHFQASERRDDLVRQEIEKERAAVNAKTAKLRTLRLAREEEERKAAEIRAAEKPPARKRKSASANANPNNANGAPGAPESA